jgi:hypothetical protein
MKKAETCKRLAACLYIIVSNCSAVAGICVCVGGGGDFLTARNMDSCKPLGTVRPVY